MISILSLIIATGSFAQRGMKWRGSDGWGTRGQYGRMYDSKTVETISGEVVSVERIAPIKGIYYGMHLMVRTDKEAFSVHLDPGWYIENQDIKIEPKDAVEVRGSRISSKGKPAIIAAEVKKGHKTLRVRDENGFPVWAGWRRR